MDGDAVEESDVGSDNGTRSLIDSSEGRSGGNCGENADDEVERAKVSCGEDGRGVVGGGAWYMVEYGVRKDALESAERIVVCCWSGCGWNVVWISCVVSFSLMLEGD